jgi:hypothetical protein
VELVDGGGGRAIETDDYPAISNDGAIVIYEAAGPHPTDVYAIQRRERGWGASVLLSRPSPFTYNGQPAITAVRTVSRDGKTLTVVTKGMTAKGESIDATMVFDRN